MIANPGFLIIWRRANRRSDRNEAIMSAGLAFGGEAWMRSICKVDTGCGRRVEERARNQLNWPCSCYILICQEQGGDLATVKMSSVVEQEVWEEFKDLARESHQSISGLLTDALREYLARKRVRPVVMSELEASMRENRRLGELLAE